MILKHLGTLTSALNNHRPLNRPLAQAVPEFNAPLRQLHRLKDGVEVISTCTASEWCVTHVESSETHVRRPLDQTTCQSLMEALCSTLFRCAHSTVTQQDDAEIINTRFAPEWCVGHRKQIGTQHHQSVDSNLHMFMKKPSRQLAAQQNNGPLCHNVTKTPNRISKKWCETHENAHLYVSRPRLLVVTECEDPLRQLHYSKDGVYVTSTGNASEWCMTHVESHGTHGYPPLDHTTSERSLERTL